MCLGCSAPCQELSHALLGISLEKSHFSLVLASGWNLVSRLSHSVVGMLGNWFSECFLCCAGLVDGGQLVQCCGAELG